MQKCKMIAVDRNQRFLQQRMTEKTLPMTERPAMVVSEFTFHTRKFEPGHKSAVNINIKSHVTFINLFICLTFLLLQRYGCEEK